MLKKTSQISMDRKNIARGVESLPFPVWPKQFGLVRHGFGLGSLDFESNLILSFRIFHMPSKFTPRVV
jgi:hypothetical protein